MTAKRDEMLAFWSERASRYGSAPQANTADEWLRKIEISYADGLIKSFGAQHVLDVGCANGYSTLQLAESNRETRFLGVDLNADMILLAQQSGAAEKSPNALFHQCDILRDPLSDRFDMIIAVRVFQNMESHEAQQEALDRLIARLRPGGAMLFIESYCDGYRQLNEDRRQIGLPALPIHSHLTLLSEEFDRYVDSRTEVITRESIASSYYFVTRLVYSKLAMLNNEAIDYDHPIHRIAAELPQIGEYGPLKATVCRKAGAGPS